MGQLQWFVVLALKGVAMGAANVIPGVSGGTIAFITGIFERLINALRRFDLKALELLARLRLKALFMHVDGLFLSGVFLGVAISIVSLAKLLEFLFAQYPIYLWSFFFGLILASVVSVGRSIRQWSLAVVVALLLGAAIAAGISFLSPAVENASFGYLFICGVIAICSMILPGISGSYVLLIMGNYFLVISAVSALDLSIILPLGLGCGFGLVAFSHLLSWLFAKFRDITVASITGFMLGSLIILWPWKSPVFVTDYDTGAIVMRKGEPVVEGYEYLLPAGADTQTLVAISLLVTGILLLLVLERLSKAPARNSQAPA